jgi:hypothetical protein
MPSNNTWTPIPSGHCNEPFIHETELESRVRQALTPELKAAIRGSARIPTLSSTTEARVRYTYNIVVKMTPMAET